MTSARPKSLNKPVECIKCHKRTFPVTSTSECRNCNPTKFYQEYQKGKGER